jgi:hypothetical protein
MNRYDETFDATVKRIFGPNARLVATVGPLKRPGQLRIVLDRRVLGIGRTFAEALQDALRQMWKDTIAV